MKKSGLDDIIKNLSKSGNGDFDIDSQDLEKQDMLYRLTRYHEDTVNRRKLAFWTAWVVSIWLFIVILILTLNAIAFKLSDNVLMVLLGTTTINVLGLPYIVLKGYFYQQNK